MSAPFIDLKQKNSRPIFYLTILAALAAVAVFLLVSARYYKVGFPLDDAWIHQTYARNLGTRGEWAFLPGQPSAGSTSPAWSLVLAAGYRLGWMPYVWTYLLGAACLIGISCSGERALRAQMPDWKSRIPWMGLLLALEWHLVWAAASGMETPLYALLIVSVFTLLFQPNPPWLLCGVLVGLTIWVRPDGITLLGPVLFTLALRTSLMRERMRAAAYVAGAVLVFVIPYLLFNRALAGSFWPNTFYAKQAEYAVLTQAPLWERIASLLQLSLVGAGIVLLPGMLWCVWKGWQKRNWAVVAAFLWWAGYTLLYALRLPVTYQHGRYMIPSMPVFFVLGGIGMADLLQNYLRGRFSRIIAKAWMITCVMVLVIFFGMGAAAYGQDVAIIETEMVASAHWVEKNTPAGALIAAHDIGALGYFGQRRILDLAGLISPDVIPWIRDETKLAQYMNQQNVQYLMTFPGWYPELIKHGDMVYGTQGSYAPRLEGENMKVFRWIIEK
jgi:hypothetical protein